MNIWDSLSPLKEFEIESVRVCEIISFLLNVTAGENNLRLKPLEFGTLLFNTYFFQLLDDNAKWLPEQIKIPVAWGGTKLLPGLEIDK